ncbi:MAG: CBS domain-containing protein [Chloroflexota bacterium]|nr:MAG: CBS domain-containing protein [Chloroflexota bacterium]
MASDLYVIGHVNPDTDSIASAMGYAWLLRERDGEEAVAARAGALNPQTTWTLKRLELDAPVLLADASPRFQSVTRRLDTALPDDPLREAWSISSRTGGIAPIVNEDGTPYGIVTGVSIFQYLAEVIGPHPRRQEMRISDLLDLSCREACDTDIPRFQASTRIRDVIHRVLREEHNDFLVVDEKGLYLGVCHQRDVLNPPRMRVILVDHNEPNQALGALDEAELIEILDHHRLGNHSTHIPIRFTVDVVGSSCSLVSERFEVAWFSAPPAMAGLLLAGLLSDTLVLTSPTTTERDHRAAERLGRWAFVRSGSLAGETIASFGQEVLSAGSGLSTRDPNEIVNSDLKLYEAGGVHFAIAQVEVTDLVQLEEHLEPLKTALNSLRERKGLDFAMLMVTDVVEGSSRLILVNPPPVLDDLPYLRQADHTFRADGVVSRKKQLLPVVLGLLES